MSDSFSELEAMTRSAIARAYGVPEHLLQETTLEHRVAETRREFGILLDWCSDELTERVVAELSRDE